ncbi:putative adhesin [Streptomyces sp. NPDC055085]
MGTCHHILHSGCRPSQSQGSERFCPCGEGSLEGAFRAASPTLREEYVVVVGHGLSAGKVSIPQGTTVKTYARPGRDLHSDVALMVIRGEDFPPMDTYYPGQEVPNFNVGPLESHELPATYQAAGDRLGKNVLLVGLHEPVTSQDIVLCSSKDICIDGFHLCDGLLGLLRGVEEIRMPVCLSPAGVPESQHKDELVYGDDPALYRHTAQLVDVIERIGREDLNAAFRELESYPPTVQAMLMEYLNFRGWTSGAREAQKQKRNKYDTRAKH